MFHQQSFYPLEPSQSEMYMDSGMAAKYANLTTIPNLMIVPSDQKYFIRDINNCLAINPGRVVTDRTTSGTFTRLMLTPTKDEVKLSNFVVSQVIKI